MQGGVSVESWSNPGLSESVITQYYLLIVNYIPKPKGTERSYGEEICYYVELEQPVSCQMLDQSQSNY